MTNPNKFFTEITRDSIDLIKGYRKSRNKYIT